MARPYEPLWQPSAERVAAARMSDFIAWLSARRSISFTDYQALWEWSVSDLEGFWVAVWDYFEVRGTGTDRVLDTTELPPYAAWFDGAEVNYAEHLLDGGGDERPAIIALSEDTPARTIGWDELRAQAASVGEALRQMGVRRGDCVAAYLPNIPEAIIGFAAAASLGAVWSICSTEYGAPSALDRLGQAQPKVLIVADGYRYGGVVRDRREAASQIIAGLDTLEQIVHVPYPDPQAELAGATPWSALLQTPGAWAPQPVPFDQPLWILYSSGTTGLPKPIVHGHGGVLLEHLKSHGLQLDLGPTDTFFWYSSTGWVMWNLLTAGLLMGSTVVTFDGDPGRPTLDALWQLAEQHRITVFGNGASFYAGCMKAGLQPGAEQDLSALRCVGSTGSPLTSDTFRWLYEQVKRDVWVMSFSGGTDVATAFVGGSPLLPVYEGEIQCRWLGVDAAALGAQGEPVEGVGELVIRRPMPSMPLRLLNDAAGSRYRETYFDTYPRMWRQGDWIEFTPSGGAVIHGRSDSTINRRGVRMGTSELYRVLEADPRVAESLVVDLEGLHGASHLVAFLVLAGGEELQPDLVRDLAARLRRDLSPRHVPDQFLAVREVPHTLNGKKLEVPVKRILLGEDPAAVVSLDAVANPRAIEEYASLADLVRRQSRDSEGDRDAAAGASSPTP